MPRRGAALALALGLAAAALAACSPLAWLGPSRLRQCPGQLVPTSEIEGEFRLRQRVRFRAEDLDEVFDVVVEKRGETITLVGFNPLGAEVFALRQEGATATIVSSAGPALRVPPRNVLRDLHRVRFLAVEGAPYYDEVVEATRGGTKITELWWDEGLNGRTFERADGDPVGAVAIEFVPAAEEARERREARIENGWCGYTATWVALEEEDLR